MARRSRFVTILRTGCAFAGVALALPAAGQDIAQDTPPAVTPSGAALPVSPADQSAGEESGEIVVTGSLLRRDPNDSALPLQIITTQELQRNAISNPEQLIGFLTTNGTGSDNLASNGDVVSGAQRGNNGASFANLRGQGAGSTLILLNGRRVAAHGLSGAAVDVNQIPFAALERVEVLKDGASAIYGTDAIGGVINFITRKDFVGIGANGFVDITERGDAPIYRVSAMAGYGDLSSQGFNIMATVSRAWNGQLNGDQRDFVNTFQPERGLSPDTRGTPVGTIFPLNATPRFPNGTLLGGTTGAALAPFLPGSTTVRAAGGVNILDLPGGEGCGSVPGQGPYADDLWAAPSARFACAWDTGRAAVLQQPLDTVTYLARGVARLGAHELSLEVTGSDATATKKFSNVQLIPNTTTQNYAFPLNTVSAPVYNEVFNRLVAVFPTLQDRYGLPIAYRWRCIECGQREITTDTETLRISGGAEGPITDDWRYVAGATYSESQSQSVLGGGYYYRDALVNALNTGVINPFLLPGQTQSQAALDLLESTSARGVVLYGGKYTLTQIDGAVSGDLFRLPGGAVQLAVGLDYRRETYSFNGDQREAAARPIIIAAPFDDGNALDGVDREIKAAYAEVLIPILPSLEISGAVRIDDYTGFGNTTNPKISAKFRPIDALMFRASYSTGFRVPTFNQIFNGRAEQVYGGADLADPLTCPGGVPNTTDPNCVSVRPDIITGGNPNLDPETADLLSAGVVFQPNAIFSAAVDWWRIQRDNTIQIFPTRDLINNFDQFQDRFLRGPANELTAIDATWANAGTTVTQGLEVALRGGFELDNGSQITAGLDGTWLLEKKEKLTDAGEFIDQLGVFTFAGDLNLRWKHNAFVAYTSDDYGVTFTQIFRKGYTNQVLPGVANGTVSPPGVVETTDDYIIYNLSAYVNVAPYFRLTAGVKNLFDTDPPFAISYDSNTGGGSSWEPRVADPRGRAFTFQVDYLFD
ncbi:TonB-dependent receptor domain-containing protein [Sphingomonas baiyangensis]|uniref:TonB-dependent receptor n=1 Tax=Sphingomonas baiyangensis TaxID=2572576 RepID=A0A4U1L7X0_9SPHN|nr:TonB-dependent receptor [Sphingomonas baiyangensis]TKD53039.1 TonB-dependent receptor [Sphingomonas baiyangensis]